MASSASSSTVSSIVCFKSPYGSSRDNPSSIPVAWPRNSSVDTLAFSRLLSVKSTASRRNGKVVAMATGESSDPSQVVQDALKSVQEAWDKTDDKLAVGGLGFAGLIVLWASAGLIGAIDKLPILPNIFEFIGILFSGWFIYRYLLFKPDREELVKKLESALSKITGTEE